MVLPPFNKGLFTTLYHPSVNSHCLDIHSHPCCAVQLGLCAACAINLYMQFHNRFAEYTKRTSKTQGGGKWEMAKDCSVFFPTINRRGNTTTVDYETAMTMHAVRALVVHYSSFIQERLGLPCDSREHMFKRGVIFHCAQGSVSQPHLQLLAHHDKRVTYLSTDLALSSH